MKKRHMALSGVAAALPFIGMDAAKAAPTDCWFAEGDADLEHFDCDVRKLVQDDLIKWRVAITPTAEALVTLFKREDGTPSRATVYYQSDERPEPIDIASGEYIIDSDGDVRVGLGDDEAMLVFRFPDHEFAGTGCSGDSCYDQASRPMQPVYRNNPPRDGLQRGTLRDTPFRF